MIRYVSTLFQRTAFQACFFNRSDISPFRINHLQLRLTGKSELCQTSQCPPITYGRRRRSQRHRFKYKARRSTSFVILNRSEAATDDGVERNIPAWSQDAAAQALGIAAACINRLVRTRMSVTSGMVSRLSAIPACHSRRSTATAGRPHRTGAVACRPPSRCQGSRYRGTEWGAVRRVDR